MIPMRVTFVTRNPGASPGRPAEGDARKLLKGWRACGARTPSVLEDLGLQRLDVMHAGDRTFPLSARIRAVALRRADPDLARLA
jgi:hypothetical protein